MTETDVDGADGGEPTAAAAESPQDPTQQVDAIADGDDEDPPRADSPADSATSARIVTLEDLDPSAAAGFVGRDDLDDQDLDDQDLDDEDFDDEDFDDDFGGYDPEATSAGEVLFDGDPEEFELDFGVSPYPDQRPSAGDLMVLDEPVRTGAPPPRRMSRMERRRRVRLQARRVRRIIRHVEPWSVLKISIFFYACLWIIFLVAGFMIWGVAESSGTVDKLENLIRDLFALETFDFDAGQIFRGYALGGLALSIAGTTFNVLMCLLFNLISDLTGGLRITMIEEETARPTPPRRRRRRPPSLR